MAQKGRTTDVNQKISINRRDCGDRMSASPAFAASDKAELDALRQSMQAQIDYLKRQLELLNGQQKDTQLQTQATAQKVDTGVAAVAKVTPPKGKRACRSAR